MITRRVHAALLLLLLLGGVPIAHAADALRIEPVGDRPLVIRKVPVIDCRAVRGFIASPVDGTVNSRDYGGRIREYPKGSGDGVRYSFNNNEGLHMTFADSDGFDVVVLRGGAKARLYANCDSLIEPADREPDWTFTGSKRPQIAQLPARLKAGKATLFGVADGGIADASFYRIGSTPPEATTVETWRAGSAAVLESPTSEFAVDNIALALKERYGDAEHRVLDLSQTNSPGAAMELEANRMVHVVMPAFADKRGLAAVEIQGAVTRGDRPRMLTCIVQDPLNPRLDVTWVTLQIPASGRISVVLDIPDQVLLPGSRVWITLSCDQKISLAAPAGGAPEFRLRLTAPEKALPEAMSWRKFLLKTLFSKLSEPRPWGSYRRQSREEFFRSSPYAAQCPELFMTIDQCHALAPDDDLVRQYREWVYAQHLNPLSTVSAPPAPPDGVPAWAWYPRLAWLETRRIAEWWLDHRLTDTGEFGGYVGDDSDMYQQFADLPFFESDGVGARLLDAAARMAELAEKENLRGGLNRNSTDALHAYEEGINHLALMARWFYGDPVYLERCMESARNMEHLTIVTADGRRHFRDTENMGARDMETPRPPKLDSHATPLMWHTALQAADYNRNPRALRLVSEWAQSWLRFMKPGEWATSIEVVSGKVLEAEKDRPLSGGYHTQATVFTWLAALTGDKRYIEPFSHFWREGKAPSPVGQFAGDCFSAGFLDELSPENLRRLVPSSPQLALFVDKDSAPLVQAAIGKPKSSYAGITSLYDARRWPDMYTEAEQFTDRVFPDLLERASTPYLGGWTRRNKFNPTLAVSWEGFSTNYAALVLVNRRDRLKLAAFSFASAPVTDRVRVWALEHGRYEVSMGPAQGDTFEMARAERTETVELARGDRVPVTLAPGRVTILELRQIEKLDDILRRADLALSARELEMTNNVIRAVVHNIGSANVAEVNVAIVDTENCVVSKRQLGSLAAPLDLHPKRLAFEIPLPAGMETDWRVVVDPANGVPEINEANNEASTQNRSSFGR